MVLKDYLSTGSKRWLRPAITRLYPSFKIRICKEGYLRSHYFKNGIMEDSVMYGLLKEDFKQQKRRTEVNRSMMIASFSKHHTNHLYTDQAVIFQNIYSRPPHDWIRVACCRYCTHVLNRFRADRQFVGNFFIDKSFESISNISASSWIIFPAFLPMPMMALQKMRKQLFGRSGCSSGHPMMQFLDGFDHLTRGCFLVI